LLRDTRNDDALDIPLYRLSLVLLSQYVVIMLLSDVLYDITRTSYWMIRSAAFALAGGPRKLFYENVNHTLLHHEYCYSCQIQRSPIPTTGILSHSNHDTIVTDALVRLVPRIITNRGCDVLWSRSVG
jgi:hypothetical protein